MLHTPDASLANSVIGHELPGEFQTQFPPWYQRLLEPSAARLGPVPSDAISWIELSVIAA
jgi:hypothetical protein